MSIITKFFAIIIVSSIAFVQSLFAEEAPTPPNTAWTVTDNGTTCTIEEDLTNVVIPEGGGEANTLGF